MKSILDWVPRPILKAVIWFYDQRWAHWLVSLTFGPLHNVMGAFYRLLAIFLPVGIWKDWQHRPQPHFPVPPTDHDIPVLPSKSDFCGTYLVTMVATYLEATTLAALLPNDVELDPAHIHEGKHSVIYMFGYTENLRAVWDPLPGMNYVEFAVGIPNVRVKRNHGYDAPFFFLPQLRLDRLYPTILGWMLGYQKIWCWVNGQDRTYTIRTLLGRRLLEAKFTPMGTTSHTFVEPNYQHWKTLLNQPQVNPFGKADLLYLHYHWDWEHAIIQPVSAEIEVHADIPGLPAGSYQFPPIDQTHWIGEMAPTGAFRVCVPFELLAPFSRRLLTAFELVQLHKANLQPPPSEPLHPQ